MSDFGPVEGPTGGHTPPSHSGFRLSIAGFVAFLVVAVLVQSRLLHGVDYAAGLAVLPMASETMDGLSTILSIGFSGEFSLIYAIVMGLLLWRRGYGLWALAPFAFLPPNVLEVVMKLLVNQPPVPPELNRSVFYPLASVSLSGTFPSGHSMRGAFLCGFLALLLAPQAGGWGRLWAGMLVVVAGLTGFTRVYLGDHWLSDVIGGLLLGGSTAGLTASPWARKLSYRIGAGRSSAGS